MGCAADDVVVVVDGRLRLLVGRLLTFASSLSMSLSASVIR